MQTFQEQGVNKCSIDYISDIYAKQYVYVRHPSMKGKLLIMKQGWGIHEADRSHKARVNGESSMRQIKTHGKAVFSYTWSSYDCQQKKKNKYYLYFQYELSIKYFFSILINWWSYFYFLSETIFSRLILPLL